MNKQEIWTQLNDIHTEFMGEITPEQLEAAWSQGQANPCGCDICQLMEAVTIAEVREAVRGADDGYDDDEVDFELEFSHWVDWDTEMPEDEPAA